MLSEDELAGQHGLAMIAYMIYMVTASFSSSSSFPKLFQNAQPATLTPYTNAYVSRQMMNLAVSPWRSSSSLRPGGQRPRRRGNSEGPPHHQDITGPFMSVAPRLHLEAP